ncbi:hypothetical protein Hamer_G026931 [Homarus americanus]|uniref:DDE-1 domain-containing protein n=1 Tax=Homarus americanus TaxID=6706 RepID=A0A8J5JS67_HOMAM|nr:hypothetical protein Hamer_G026931 [Homarus americanus]
MRKATDSQDEVNELNNTNDSDVEDDPASVSGNSPTLKQDPASNSCSNITQQNVLSVKQFWKQFHIRSAVNHMVAAWNKITLATIKHAWKPLFPHPSNARSAVQRRADLLEAAVESARSVPAAGFREVDAERIDEMLKGNNEEMMDDVAESSDEAGEGDAEEKCKITASKLSLILNTCSNLQELVDELSENERASLVSKVEAITNTFMPRYQRKIN